MLKRVENQIVNRHPMNRIDQSRISRTWSRVFGRVFRLRRHTHRLSKRNAHSENQQGQSRKESETNVSLHCKPSFSESSIPSPVADPSRLARRARSMPYSLININRQQLDADSNCRKVHSMQGFPCPLPFQSCRLTWSVAPSSLRAALRVRAARRRSQV